MARTSGPTLVPNGKLAFRYPTLIPATWAETAEALAASADAGEMPYPMAAKLEAPISFKNFPVVVSTLVKSGVPKIENMFLLVTHSDPSTSAPITGMPFDVRYGAAANPNPESMITANT